MVESCKKTLIDINASIALLRQQIAFDKDIVPYLQLLHKHFSKLEIDLLTLIREKDNDTRIQ